MEKTAESYFRKAENLSVHLDNMMISGEHMENYEKKIEELASELTLDEKIGMLHGDGLFRQKLQRQPVRL